jgi:hypothetical protein
MDNSLIGEIPQPDKRDKLYNLAIIASAFVPFPGIPEIIGVIMKSPIEKRRDEWFQSLADGLNTLVETVEELTSEKLSQNEVFVSTVMETTQIAIRTHQEDIRQALRNAVLNAALPNAPDDVQQKMFVQWLHEFTPWHIKVLKVFDSPHITDVSLDLDDQDWMMNIGLSDLGKLIESTSSLARDFLKFIESPFDEECP